MQIEKNKVVSLHYKLQEGDADGTMVEESFGGQPLTFLYGAGQMIPQFEANLEGKEAGDKLSFGIKSEDAYGEYNDEAVISVAKEAFMVDGKLAEDMLQVGKSVPMQDANGNRLNGLVKEVQDDNVVMDFNHPMAGKDLYFSVEVKDVREATDSEIEHGHAHGPGGHQH